MLLVLASDRPVTLVKTCLDRHHLGSYQSQKLYFDPSFVFYGRDRTHSCRRAPGDGLHAYDVHVSLGGGVDVPLVLPFHPPVRVPL